MKYSKFQKKIFDFSKNEKNNLIINAVAGSGKTTTLLEVMKVVSGSSFFGAFNKSIADELSKRVPENVECSTLHSLGFKIIRNNLGRVKLENRKVEYIMNTMPSLEILKSMSSEEKAIMFSKRRNLQSIISICKANFTDYHNTQSVQDTCDYYSIDYDPLNYPLVVSLFDKILAQKAIIDFDDMVWFPVVFNMKPCQYDNVFVDEAQDLNKTQMNLILSIKKKSGRIFVVGDPKQSIYGFRGADSDAMLKLKDILNATELPLSVCYRCPVSHIELVQNLVPNIESCDTAKPGIIDNIKEDQFLDTVKEDVKDNPLVLCRINAPVVGFALKLIANNIKAIVKGRDIGANLISIVKSLKTTDINSLYNDIRDWEETEISKLYKRNAPQSTIDLVTDKAETIRLISDNSTSITGLIQNIENLFSDENIDGVTFSTVHKAKGLEANSVYILKPELLPLVRKNQKDWELEQEYNIQYVAYTRSKNKLVFVNK
jgi:superfamily I DNA/RNA helicase